MDWRTLPITLELADVLWADENAFTARHGVLQVRLARVKGAVQVEVALSRPAPFERVCARSGTPRGGDMLSAGPAFDDVLAVSAEEWNHEGTRRLLASPAVLGGLRALVSAGGEASSSRLVATVEAPRLESIKAALKIELDLGAALALQPHERKQPPAQAVEARRLKAKVVRIDEDSETAVDEWVPGCFRIHNPWLKPTTFEVDLNAATLQIQLGVPVPFTHLGELVVNAGADPARASLDRRHHDGRTSAVCTGRLRSVESLMRALELLGLGASAADRS